MRETSIPAEAKRGGGIAVGVDRAGNVTVVLRDDAGIIFALSAVSPAVARSVSSDLVTYADLAESRASGGLN